MHQVCAQLRGGLNKRGGKKRWGWYEDMMLETIKIEDREKGEIR